MDSTAYVIRTYSRLTEVATRHSEVYTRPGYTVMTHHMIDYNLYHMTGTVLKQHHLKRTGLGFTSSGGRILTLA
jgi:hypothetical protein